jgi:hypothetical protein
MIQYKARLVRYNDEYFTRISIVVPPHNGTSTSIQFVTGTERVRIFSTNKGFIYDEQVFVPNSEASIDIDFQPGVQSVDCILSTYRYRDLVSSSSNVVSVPSIPHVSNPAPAPLEIKTVSKNYKERMEEFKKILLGRRSSWVLSLESNEDISLTVLSGGDAIRLMCVGERSDRLLSSDFLFYLYPGTKKINIPRGLLSHSKEVAAFELVVPDFLPTKNSYFKLPASNRIGAK